jgi:hypothetical protein
MNFLLAFQHFGQLGHFGGSFFRVGNGSEPEAYGI